MYVPMFFMLPHPLPLPLPPRMQLREKLEKGQDRVITLQTGRQQVYSKLGEWFK